VRARGFISASPACVTTARRACTHGEVGEELLTSKLLHHATLLSDAGVRVLVAYLRAGVGSGKDSRLRAYVKGAGFPE
jgi:hypothetical protein